jgi:hypothetical protein
VFGVVVESNWVVCEQDPQGGETDADKVKLIVDRPGLCGGAEGGSTGSTTDGSSIVVPNVIGLDLQTAQDTLQAAGFFDLGSHDVTGQSSLQIIDSNWEVVDQVPAAGSNAETSAHVELGVKRR